MGDDRTNPTVEAADNVDEAAAPQAIAPPVAPKLPISDNDPTRNVSSGARWRRLAAIVVAVAALVALAIAVVAAVAQRS